MGRGTVKKSPRSGLVGRNLQAGPGRTVIQEKANIVEACVPEYPLPVLFGPNEMPCPGF